MLRSPQTPDPIPLAPQTHLLQFFMPSIRPVAAYSTALQCEEPPEKDDCRYLVHSMISTGGISIVMYRRLRRDKRFPFCENRVRFEDDPNCHSRNDLCRIAGSGSRTGRRITRSGEPCVPSIHRIQWFDARVRTGRYPSARSLLSVSEISHRQAQRDD